MMAVLPVVQLLLFGYAINTDVRHIPTVVFDQDRSAESRDLARTLEATGFYDMLGNVQSYDEIERALRSAEAQGRRWSSRADYSKNLRPRCSRAGAAGRRRLRSADGGERDQHRRVARGSALERAHRGQARSERRGIAAEPIGSSRTPGTTPICARRSTSCPGSSASSSP